MKSSEILREAARMVERGESNFACHAISMVGGNCREIEAFQLLRPTYAERDLVNHDEGEAYSSSNNLVLDGDFWWWMHYGRNEYRILGLCLAAAIAESEGD